MSIPINIQRQARRAQSKSAHPGRSAWVEANAGSGKTYLVTSRIIRLLLNGVPPSAIVCLTFTDAVAVHMTERLFERLRLFVGADESSLRASLRSILGKEADAREQIIARRLFADALETPGGIKIQTIHAFCERLLHWFPLEAAVSPNFVLLDELSADSLLVQSVDAVIADDVRRGENSALRRLQLYLPNGSIIKTLQALVRKQRDIFAPVHDDPARFEAMLVALHKALAPARPKDEIDKEILDVKKRIDGEEARRLIADIEASGGKRAGKRAIDLGASVGKTGQEALHPYLAAFTRSDGLEVVAENFLVTKPFTTSCPLSAERLCEERKRLGALVDERRERERLEITDAFLRLGQACLRRFERSKAAHRVLDFDDLIAKVVKLFERQSLGWVHYKLDQSFDHLLVDEAQDTAPEHWRLIDHLCAEMVSGEGVPGPDRTFFAVGDSKQSIYGFQGVDPELFVQQRTAYAERFGRAARPFDHVDLLVSYRSTDLIMEAVEAIFGRSTSGRESPVYLGTAFPRHLSRPEATGGSVELWPLIRRAVDEKTSDPWEGQMASKPVDSPHVKLARHIALMLKNRLGSAVPLRNGQPWRPRDILILLRERKALFHALIFELKRHGIPIAGADRLQLNEHIAVQDLMALGQFIVFSGDDLNLASLLKGPFFGLDDNALMSLAIGRGGTLLQALHRQAASGGPFSEVRDKLMRWHGLGLRLTPYGFFQQILGSEGGMKALLGRLGYEAEEAVNVFLEEALLAEKDKVASMRIFLDGLKARAREVKRPIVGDRDEVRIMTVHGAKGLEAPIVILPDTTKMPRQSADSPIVKVPLGESITPLWSWGQSDPLAELVDVRKARRQEGLEEYHRLLYVALTRARETLIIAGAEPKRGKVQPESWYAVCARGLGYDMETRSQNDDLKSVKTPLGRIMLWRAAQVGGRAKVGDQEAEENPEAPAWLFTHAPKDGGGAARGIAPSRTRALGPKNEDEPESFRRGLQWHKVLEAFCAHDDAKKERDLASLVRLHADERHRARMTATLSALWADRKTRWILGADGLSEVPIRGRLPMRTGETVMVSGIVDRLVRRADALWVIDFKTGRARARSDYLDQISLYRALLSLMERGPVRAGILWIDDHRLTPLGERLYNQSLARLGIA